MKAYKIISFLMAVFVCLFAASVNADNLRVTIENTEIAEGHIMLRLLQGQQEFAGEAAPILVLQRRAVKGALSFSVEDLPQGEYAIQVMHDVNGNGELDTNFVGIPSEPWGFSNNATGRMGPPKWEDVKFVVTDETTQSIRLNH